MLVIFLDDLDLLKIEQMKFSVNVEKFFSDYHHLKGFH